MFKRIALIVLCLCLPSVADSPITSTEFWQHYSQIPEVQRAHDTNRLDDGLSTFLLSAKPIDQKAALINALSWNDKASPRNFTLFRERLGKKYRIDPSRINSKLTADEAFCLGYMTALDSYNSPTFALGLMRQAQRDNPRSFTVAILTGVVESQVVFSDFSRIWPTFTAAYAGKDLKMDMLPAARDSILEYMKLYEDDARP